MTEISRESLIKKAQELAAADGRPYVLRADFIRRTGIGDHHVLKHFDSWTEFFKEAGLEPRNRRPASDTELLEASRKAFIVHEGIPPTFIRFSKIVPYSGAVYKKRWHTWPSFLAAFHEWIVSTEPSFPHLAQLESMVRRDSSVKVVAEPHTAEHHRANGWQSTGGSRFGPFLNFRGLQHAPVNEQGVVLLFGMVAFELGYVVESVATGFPDCEAKRRIKGPSESWERIRIEFEYQSRNFLDHGHDPSKCEVVVCWEHNWPDCPVEVLELSSAIQELDNEA